MNNDNENKKIKKENITRRLIPTGISVPEGEVHKKIKKLIASNPSLYLNETGLMHIETEYVFNTNDRVDLLLRDQYGRFIVVEVEPECEKNNHIGSAQCMKYRSLLSFERERKENEVRAILAAIKISRDVVEKAKKYNIETKEIKVQP